MVEIKTGINDMNNTVHIEVAMNKIEELTTKQIERYATELIANAIRNLVAMNYDDLEKIVNDVVHSQEIKDLIYRTVSEEVKQIAREYARSIFGDNKLP